MKHHVCAWYVRTLVYVHVCTYIAQSITTLTETSIDSYGNYVFIVVVEHFTKYVSLYPVKDHVCAWYVRTLVYVHVCTYIAQSIKNLLLKLLLIPTAITFSLLL